MVEWDNEDEINDENDDDDIDTLNWRSRLGSFFIMLLVGFRPNHKNEIGVVDEDYLEIYPNLYVSPFVIVVVLSSASCILYIIIYIPSSFIVLGIPLILI